MHPVTYWPRCSMGRLFPFLISSHDTSKCRDDDSETEFDTRLLPTVDTWNNARGGVKTNAGIGDKRMIAAAARDDGRA